MVGNDNVVEAALDLLFVNAQYKEEKKKKGEEKAKESAKKPTKGQQDAKKKAEAKKTAETGKKTETETKGYGASGSAGGLVLTANKVSTFAKAEIVFTGASQGAVSAGGTLTVTAQDTAGIDSHSELVQDVVTTNTLEGLVPLVNSVLLPNDYKYTTASGPQSLRLGDRVRLGAAYARRRDRRRHLPVQARGDVHRGRPPATQTVRRGAEPDRAPAVRLEGPRQRRRDLQVPRGGADEPRHQPRRLHRPTLWQRSLTNLGAEDYTDTAAWEQAQRRRLRPRGPLPGHRQLHELRRARDRDPDRPQRRPQRRDAAITNADVTRRRVR